MSFDFDQRITLSLLGKIGNRLQLTANYDTESTFDFQNLIKVQYNPPKAREPFNYDRLDEKNINNKIYDIENKLDNSKDQLIDAKNKILDLKNKGN